MDDCDASYYTEGMQYYKPAGDLNVGDGMPFYHDGVFRLYYLLDEGHHQALGGLGGHQWAQMTSRDLISWEHHPLAIPITDPREGSICTGSVLFHNEIYHGFYATRMHDRTEHLSLAVSRDGIHFEKQVPNPFASPPAGYSPYHYRDPCVFYSPVDGHFHLLVTAWLEDYPITGRGGCLAHLVSEDLHHWEQRAPFLIPGLLGAPECPDYFAWRGWYYLVFSSEGLTRYRMSRDPFGRWLRPPVDTLDGPAARVMKTAAFAGDRRIGVAWIGTRAGNAAAGAFQFGGNALFRELVQLPDGALGTKFPAEMVPAAGAATASAIASPMVGAEVRRRSVQLAARPGLAAAFVTGLAQDARLRIRISPMAGAGGFGLRLRAAEVLDSGYDLHFAPYDGTVCLNQQTIYGLTDLDSPFDLEIVLKGDLIDVCIDGQRTLIDRCPEQVGERIFVYAQDAEVAFDLLEMAPLL